MRSDMRKVVVLSGTSGSGKSTYARKLILEHLGIQVGDEVSLEHILAVMPDDDPRCTISYVSADRWFMKDGEYRFNPAELSQAHNSCFLAYISALLEEKELVIVDNTNTSEVEIAPYMLAAGAYDYEAEIITLTPGHTMNWVDYYAQCAKRNAHGVGFETIKAQHKRLVNRNLPPWWKNTDILAGAILAKVG